MCRPALPRSVCLSTPLARRRHALPPPCRRDAAAMPPPGQDDFLLYMGRDKYENEELIRYGLPSDVW